jgi:hypothetical protein
MYFSKGQKHHFVDSFVNNSNNLKFPPTKDTSTKLAYTPLIALLHRDVFEDKFPKEKQAYFSRPPSISRVSSPL